MQQIRQQLDPHQRMPDVEWEAFSQKLKQRKLPKKTTLVRQGQVEKFLSFTEQGIVRFFIPGLDKEVTFAFAFDQEFFCAYDSFVQQSPSVYQVETLTEATLWSIHYDDLQTLYMTIPTGNYFGRLAAEQLYIKKIARELSLLNQTAAQRYQDLFTQSPRLIRQIPLKYLASYIGITPQALSRIRRRIS